MAQCGSYKKHCARSNFPAYRGKEWGMRQACQMQPYELFDMEQWESHSLDAANTFHPTPTSPHLCPGLSRALSVISISLNFLHQESKRSSRTSPSLVGREEKRSQKSLNGWCGIAQLVGGKAKKGSIFIPQISTKLASDFPNYSHSSLISMFLFFTMSV